MPLYIQDPDDPEALYLLEALFEACEHADRGGAAFAFASAAGAKLFLENRSFTEFASQNEFELIVGVDAVTNTEALHVLGDAAGRLNGLTSRVYLHQRPGCLFHPKYCWFTSGKQGRLIVGSGNLTVGGLLTNVEAFTVTDMTSDETEGMLNSWTTWTERNKGSLLPTDDNRAVTRAAENNWWAYMGSSNDSPAVPRGTTGQDSTEDITIPPITLDNSVLLAELPAAGNRWNQGNFDIDSYVTFFGADANAQRIMFFREVGLDGIPRPVEVRPSVAVSSHNFRFQFRAGSGVPYPAEGRPIGVFVRRTPRRFYYLFLMPGAPHYTTVLTFLTQRAGQATDHMRRITVPAFELRQAWPDSPLWAVM